MVTSALAKPSLPFGDEAPVGEPALGGLERLVGDVGELAGQPELFGQRFGKAVRQRPAKQLAEAGAARRASPGAASRRAVGQEVDRDRLAVPPVGRDLQDRRPG